MGDKKTSYRWDLGRLDPGKPARRARRDAEAAATRSEQAMDRQRMMEEARIADEDDRIKRKRMMSRGGGRSLLISSSPLGTTDELGGGGMYG